MPSKYGQELTIKGNSVVNKGLYILKTYFPSGKKRSDFYSNQLSRKYYLEDIHIVGYGESLYSIAQDYDVSVSDY